VCTWVFCSPWPAEGTLGVLGDWVPAGFRNKWRLAALTSRREAGVSAAATTIPLAREVVPQDVLAAYIILTHTGVAAAPVAMGTLKLVTIPVCALDRRLPAFRLFADRVPCANGAPRLAALAARSEAGISAASASLPLAGETVPIRVLATDIIFAHTCPATTLVSTSALEGSSVVIHTMNWRLATPRG